MITADCQHELESILKAYLEEGESAPHWVGARLGTDCRYEVISTTETHSGRWSRWDLVVVRGPLSSLWGYEVESPLTELQEVELPESYEVFPVEAVPAMVYRRAQ